MLNNVIGQHGKRNWEFLAFYFIDRYVDANRTFKWMTIADAFNMRSMEIAFVSENTIDKKSERPLLRRMLQDMSDKGWINFMVDQGEYRLTDAGFDVLMEMKDEISHLRKSFTAKAEEGLEGIIAWGLYGGLAIPPSLRDSSEAMRLFVSGYDSWRLAKSLSEPRLRNFIRGLVLYHRATGEVPDGHGSASPVIHYYSEYIKRFPDSEPSLTAWIVDNRVNGYEPFGRWGIKARSQAELIAISQEDLKRQSKQSAKEALDHEARGLRETQKATERLADAVRRGDLKAVKALIEKGADPRAALPQGGSLQRLAVENKRLAVLEYLQEKGIE